MQFNINTIIITSKIDRIVKAVMRDREDSGEQRGNRGETGSKIKFGIKTKVPA